MTLTNNGAFERQLAEQRRYQMEMMHRQQRADVFGNPNSVRVPEELASIGIGLIPEPEQPRRLYEPESNKILLLLED